MEVRFIRSTLFEGVDCTREVVYDLPEETAKALGSDVVILEPVKPVTKEVEHAPKDTMIKKSPKTK